MALRQERLDLVSLVQAQLLVSPHGFLFVVVEEPTEGVRQLSLLLSGGMYLVTVSGSALIRP